MFCLPQSWIIQASIRTLDFSYILECLNDGNYFDSSLALSLDTGAGCHNHRHFTLGWNYSKSRQFIQSKQIAKKTNRKSKLIYTFIHRYCPQLDQKQLISTVRTHTRYVKYQNHLHIISWPGNVPPPTCCEYPSRGKHQSYQICSLSCRRDSSSAWGLVQPVQSANHCPRISWNPSRYVDGPPAIPEQIIEVVSIL